MGVPMAAVPVVQGVIFSQSYQVFLWVFQWLVLWPTELVFFEVTAYSYGYSYGSTCGLGSGFPLESPSIPLGIHMAVAVAQGVGLPQSCKVFL